VSGVQLIHRMVTDGRITPLDGAILLEFRREVLAARRWPSWLRWLRRLLRGSVRP
jgi:hypothetical protein